MGKPRRKCVDPLFGNLIFNVLWKGSISLEPFGVVEIQIDGGMDDVPPTESQRNAVVRLGQVLPSLEPKIYEKILSFYSNYRDIALPSSSSLREIPRVTSARTVRQLLVGHPALMVGPHRRGKAPTLNLDWTVTFDEEHVLSVEFVNEEVGEVGLI